jgi:hypothetical protein
LADSKLKLIFHDPAVRLSPFPGVGGLGHISPAGAPADEYLRENTHFLTTLLFSPLKFAISFFNFE